MLPDTTLFNQFNNKARKTRTPISAFFELTPRCTLDCKMCYIHLTEEQMHGRTELPASDWIRIIDQAVERGLMFVMLTGGECMMHKDFKEIFLHLKKKNIFISVNANGTLLTDDYIDFFVKNPPSRIKISMYGASEEGYYNVTGRRVYEKVRSSILKAQAAGLNLKISVSVSKYLKDELFDIIDFCREHNLQYGIDMDMHQAEEETGRDMKDYALSAEEIVELMLEMHRRYSTKPLYDNPPVEIPDYDTSGEVARALSCGAGRALFTVKWDGKIQPCFASEKSVNILETTFDEAWEQLGRFTEDVVVPVECRKCKLLKICNSCAYTRTDPHDFGHRDPNICRGTVLKYNAGLIKL